MREQGGQDMYPRTRVMNREDENQELVTSAQQFQERAWFYE